MKTIFSLITITAFLLAFGAAKVLLRTNPGLALTIMGGSGLFLAICWYLYPKIKNL